MTHSILFMSFGQSNADCHDAGPAFDHPVLDDPRIVLPNDGHGFRGLRGFARNRPIDGFDPAYGFDQKCQSSGIASAARFLNDVKDKTIGQVIVRSAAKGGRPLVGRKHGDRIIDGIFREHDGTAAILLLNMIEDIYLIAAAAAEQGKPIRNIYIPFYHGEADRSTPRDTYNRLLQEMMDIVDSAAADIGIPTVWLLTQPSGTSPTHAGNAWENRLGIKEVADRRPNAVLASANYAMPLFDPSHLSATGKVLAGEQIGRCAARIHNGEGTPATISPREAIANGNKIHVRFHHPVKTTVDRVSVPAPMFTDGFHIDGQPADFVRRAIPTPDGHLTLFCNGPVPEDCKLNYAFAARRGNDPTEDVAYPFGRGCLRKTESTASLILPNMDIHEWVPAFSVPVTQAAAQTQPVREKEVA